MQPFEKWTWIPFRIRWAFITWKIQRLNRRLRKQIGARATREIMKGFGEP